MNLPSREECFRLLRKHGAVGKYSTVVAHSFVVNKVAVWLATQLKAAGIDIDVELIDRASLLHDVGKVIEINSKTGPLHDEIGYSLLVDKYPEVAILVLKHVIFRAEECKTWEEKVILYSDLRVVYSRIASFEDRLNYLRDKYYANPKSWNLLASYVNKVSVMEKELFKAISKSPESLNHEVNTASMPTDL